MKIIFVDAENIGLKELEKVKATVVDKVFVFSKSDFTKAINELSKANKIQRSEGSKRKWVQC
ncbi:hypothetical protein ACN3E9_00880 [Vibrio pectenicida]|uniref:hypothetical protein n=1 Tax=Vibrio pectenicida TaxID=62763 RepID=UPI003B9BF196